MNTNLGYSKLTLTDSNVLLSGGGHKALSDFVGTLYWDSTNKKIQYKKVGDTNYTDLLTFGSNAFNSTSYLPLSGGTMTGDITFPNNKGVIQNQASTSNYTVLATWLKGGTSLSSWNPEIGQHNLGGGDGSGSICILPYATTTAPYSGSVGLFIEKNHVYIDGTELSKVGHGHDTISSLGNRTTTTSDNMSNYGVYTYNMYAGAGTAPQQYMSAIGFGSGMSKIEIAGSWGDDYTGYLYWRSKSDRDISSYPWKSWRMLIDSTNISSQSVSYATTAGGASWAHYLPPKYDGGDLSNPQTYFNEGIGLRVAMTRYADLGYGTSWHDTLWINGYSGGDVTNMCALTFKRNGEPRFYVSSQSNRSTSYGSMYEVITTYNLSSYVSGGGGGISLPSCFSFVGSDMPEIADNIASYNSAHTMTFRRNAIMIPYQANDPNDGGFFRVRGISESSTICEIGTWDDSGGGETIQFNYYPTTSTVNPTYSISVPKKSGTIALLSDIPSSSGNGIDASIELNQSGNLSGYGGFIDFHYNGSSADYTSRIIEDASGKLNINLVIFANYNGYVGVGDQNPAYRLEVSGNCRISSTLLVSTTATDYTLNVGGTVGATNFYTTSDIRKKTNIINISDSIRQFNWKDSGDLSYGFIAQELEKTNPELINKGEDHWTVNYNAAICLVIARLENRIKELEKQLGV